MLSIILGMIFLAFIIYIKEGLTALTDEEADEIKNYKSPEEIAEEERLAKLPNQEEVLKMKTELILINMLEEGGLV